jgi:hypothetical protein
MNVEQYEHDVELTRKHHAVLECLMNRDIAGAESVGLQKWDWNRVEDGPNTIARLIIREGGPRFSHFFAKLGFSIPHHFKGSQAKYLLRYMVVCGQPGMVRNAFFHGAKLDMLLPMSSWITDPIPFFPIDYNDPIHRIHRVVAWNLEIVQGRRAVYQFLHEEMHLDLPSLSTEDQFVAGQYK